MSPMRRASERTPVYSKLTVRSYVHEWRWVLLTGGGVHMSERDNLVFLRSKRFL